VFFEVLDAIGGLHPEVVFEQQHSVVGVCALGKGAVGGVRERGAGGSIWIRTGVVWAGASVVRAQMTRGGRLE
jgi:hypothetical protein